MRESPGIGRQAIKSNRQYPLLLHVVCPTVMVQHATASVPKHDRQLHARSALRQALKQGAQRVGSHSIGTVHDQGLHTPAHELGGSYLLELAQGVSPGVLWSMT